MEDKILQGLAYALPALVTGGVAYLILSKFIDIDNKEKKFNALIEKKKDSIPIKLEAYERLTLFSERVNPMKLLVRVSPIDQDPKSYEHLLIGNIEQEFEHNLVQQLYVSDITWKAVIGAKLNIIKVIRELSDQCKTANELQEKLLKYYNEKESPTETVVAVIKNDVKKML